MADSELLSVGDSEAVEELDRDQDVDDVELYDGDGVGGGVIVAEALMVNEEDAVFEALADSVKEADRDMLNDGDHVSDSDMVADCDPVSDSLELTVAEELTVALSETV